MSSELRVDKIIPTSGVPSGGGGGVIQMVFGSTTSEVTVTSGANTDTGITATITPKFSTSKIMVITSVQWELYREATEVSGSFELLRGSTVISDHDDCVHAEAGTTGQSRIIFEGGYTIQVLDSPNTTSATTYKLQTKLGHTTANSAHIRVNRRNAPGCITLMEVSA
tara:strand:+ start:731 stop:1231 length:501 start_codon:yes stop_codon:yes gene_type:complete